MDITFDTVSYTHLAVYKRQEQEDGTMIPNENSMVVLDHVMVEPHIKTAQKGDRFQFMRQGYFSIDPVDTTAEKLVFNQIVSLKDSFAKQVLAGK